MSQRAPRQRAFPLLSCGRGRACVARAGRAGLAQSWHRVVLLQAGKAPPDQGLSPSVAVIALFVFY